MEIRLDWLGCATFRLTLGETVVFLDAYMDRVPTAPKIGLSAKDVRRADFVLWAMRTSTTSQGPSSLRRTRAHGSSVPTKAAVSCGSKTWRPISSPHKEASATASQRM
ncbi:MAG: hypothetical protein IPN07_00330 [Dehalococcoidia bacterium]|nr:hypothetical protein [Dehalococcoidia bacterium]